MIVVTPEDESNKSAGSRNKNDEGGARLFNISSSSPLHFEVFLCCAMLIGRRQGSNIVHMQYSSAKGMPHLDRILDIKH